MKGDVDDILKAYEKTSPKTYEEAVKPINGVRYWSAVHQGLINELEPLGVTVDLTEYGHAKPSHDDPAINEIIQKIMSLANTQEEIMFKLKSHNDKHRANLTLREAKEYLPVEFS